MAASAKRKQEEKHLKMLREMTSLAHNRKCFDCDQRGPTYANMTMGSFVCTSCSGILRGLNPPHRVKSISMTTFTQQEIEFLQKHGNEVCKQIWLGLYDERNTSLPDFREPQKVKEFLQEKYEKKRWYIPPEQARVAASVHASVSGSSNSSTSSTPEVRPLKTLLGESVPSLQLSKNTPPNQSPVVSRGPTHQQLFHDKKFDLLSDLGGDIFAGPTNVNSAASSGFANFAHFNSHARGIPTGLNSGLPPKQPTVQTGGDRYAALAELDTAFSPSVPATSVYNTTSTSQGRVVFGSETGVSTVQAHQGMPGMTQSFGAAPSTNPFVAAGAAPAAAPTNPFQCNGRAASLAAAAAFGTVSMSMPAGFGNAAAYNLPTSFSGTFQTPFPGQPPFPQPHPYPQQPNGGFPAYGPTKPVMAPFGQTMAGPMASSNPFLGSGPTAQYPASGSSTNPFL
ncbi:arf-GAP domain and FG repeat-containing protein 1a isoform X8 [Gouania willdenowi]|uniref:arf-GAP domain and FG repeat-containing protein 1a isoform X8 n=1 Tax=Gouania willdenowi TaxID=441366 RepID=UPI0010551EA2|nr:arf-GAP domain and FG repeat-containing protein 1 isoform X8 [Gouania willdenowi]